RFEAYLEQKRRRELEAPPPTTMARHSVNRLATEVPDYWVPLLPVWTEQGLRLKRGAVLKTGGLPEPVHALGRILESSHERSLFEEEHAEAIRSLHINAVSGVNWTLRAAQRLASDVPSAIPPDLHLR